MKLAGFLLAIIVTLAGCKKSESSKSASSGDEPAEQASAGDGAPVTLRVKWPVGSRYSQRMEVNGDTETRMPQSPKPMQQKISLNQEYNITVLAQRPNGGRELELEVESAEIDVTMNGKPVVNLDTKAEAGPAEANAGLAAFRQIIGTKIKFLIDASNQVEKVEGVQAFAARAMAGSNPQGRAAMQSMFSEDYFKQMVDTQRALPPGPVKVGESWPYKDIIAIPSFGAMTLDLTYTLKGWEQRQNRKCAAIDFSGSMISTPATNAAQTAMSMKMESGRISGRTWFDPELGNTVETALDQDLVMHITVPVPRPRATNASAAQLPATQTITNNTKQKVVIKLVDLVTAAK